jgi:hypothetical protein
MRRDAASTLRPRASNNIHSNKQPPTCHPERNSPSRGVCVEETSQRLGAQRRRGVSPRSKDCPECKGFVTTQPPKAGALPSFNHVFLRSPIIGDHNRGQPPILFAIPFVSLATRL